MRAARATSDAEARERILTSLDESLIVEASAGTGKTTMLVRRIVEVLATGRAKIDQIAAVTFTHKAAGEMKLRLRQELDDQRHAAEIDRKRRLEDALERLEEASIGTIHSFCAQILRERPVEAKVDPAFEEASEQEADRIFQSAFRAWLERRLNDDSPGLRRAFARLAWRDSWDDGPALEQLQWAGRKLIEWRDYPAPWRRDAEFARNEELDTLVRLTRDVAALSSRPRRVTDTLYRGLEPARAVAGRIERTEGSGSGDHDAMEGLLLKLGRDLRRDTRKGSGEYGGGVAREKLVEDRDELIRWIEEFRIKADADLAALLREEMRGLLDEYQERKRRLGKLDFVDLLSFVRNLLREHEEVRRYLQSRFTRIFVDEFQDTDPLQVEILRLLTDDDSGGKLFLVGDPKQSIYKFRRADLALYRQVREDLESRGVGHLTLTRSFRSVPNIQHFINTAFETEMTGDVEEGHAEWAALERDRNEIPDRPSVVVLPVPKPYKKRLSKEAVNESLPDAIAAFVDWLVRESKWECEVEGEMRPVRARDIAVLFRRRTQGGVDLTRDYARALEARGLPHLLAGSKSFHRREEVETLRSALTAVEWPEDELSVFATLKGSLFAIPDEALLLYRHTHGRLYPFAKHERDARFTEIEQALQLLADLHRERNQRPFAATVNALLEAVRAHAGFLLRPGGQQIRANVARVAELARTFEMTGGISFRGFVEELAAHAEKGEASEAPVLEEDSDGVRLMTVHGAKGLEFPVVILADMTANISSREPDQFVDTSKGLSATRLLRCAPWELMEHAPDEARRERAEGVRVAYVAATRARDLLVVPAVGDEPFPVEGWLSPLHKAIFPARVNWRKSQRPVGCPPFGEASVVARPLEYDQGDEYSVRPGLIQPENGLHEVVWWDPFKLKLGEETTQTVWQDQVLAKTLQEDGGASFGEYRAWQEARAAQLGRGAKPEVEVFLASQAVEVPPGAPVAVEYLSAVGPARKVSGKRFGTLVHSLLRDAALHADSLVVRRLADLNARILGAPSKEAKAAHTAVVAALEHPVLARARAAARCHREYPLTLRLADGRLLEGVIDLAFVEEGRWVVVDFKTDANSPERLAQYERQLQWYAYALAELTGIPARGILLGV
ncbi:MAG TPA: UvrD-helicase domain-containing protein [Bryobacteraceae bacterium]